MTAVAKSLSAGRGVTQDPEAAVGWYRRAADLGDVGAQRQLALALAQGLGVKKDVNAAADLYRKVISLEDTPDGRFVWPVEFIAAGQALAELHRERSIRNASREEVKRLEERYGAEAGGMKRFTVPVSCGSRFGPSVEVFVVDWSRPEDPVKAQAAWYSTVHGCSLPADALDAFAKIYEIARNEKVSYADLVVYSMGKNTDGAATDASAPK